MSLIGRGRVFAPFWFENWYRFCLFWSFTKELQMGARNNGRASARETRRRVSLSRPLLPSAFYAVTVVLRRLRLCINVLVISSPNE